MLCKILTIDVLLKYTFPTDRTHFEYFYLKAVNALFIDIFVIIYIAHNIFVII